MFRYDDSPTATDLAQKTRTFLNEVVIPHEAVLFNQPKLPDGLIDDLRQKARQAGVYGPQIAPEFGGLGLSLRDCVPVFEAAGHSLLGPLALNCSAPDEGNIHLLDLIATPDQRERYLRPLAEGRVRSGFAMTEPAPGAGSDPRMLLTEARRDGPNWVINGRKWFTTGADGAAFFFVMARSDPNAHPYVGSTLFIVDAGHPGLEIVRKVPTLGDSALPVGHYELQFTDCTVTEDAVSGRVGGGFKAAQLRLSPARLTHCMRWTGAAERALEIAMNYANQREAFGSPLADKQSIQWMLADSALALHFGKLAVRQAATLVDSGDEARLEVSAAKVFVAENVFQTLDRAVQICGALGFTHDTPLALMFAEARAFRIYDGPSEVHRMVLARAMLKPGSVIRE